MLDATEMGCTHTWNKRKAQERLQIAVCGGVSINDHTTENQRGGCFYVAHIIRAVRLWPCFLLGLSSVSAKGAGSPSLTNTSAGIPMDTDPLQQVKHFAGLSPCLRILQFVCTDNLQ